MKEDYSNVVAGRFLLGFVVAIVLAILGLCVYVIVDGYPTSLKIIGVLLVVVSVIYLIGYIVECIATRDNHE